MDGRGLVLASVLACAGAGFHVGFDLEAASKFLVVVVTILSSFHIRLDSHCSSPFLILDTAINAALPGQVKSIAKIDHAGENFF
jgi:hypothetical protein